MPSVDQAQRCISDAYAVLDELTKYVSMAEKDYVVKVSGSEVSIRLPPEKVAEVLAKVSLLTDRLKSLAANIKISQ